MHSAHWSLLLCLKMQSAQLTHVGLGLLTLKYLQGDTAIAHNLTGEIRLL